MPGVLWEREGELAALSGALDRAEGGDGTLVCVEGSAGIGKTALVEAALDLGRVRGVRLLSARGDELEREFPFAVVRQLFEPTVREFSAEERRELLAGAAELATPVVAPYAAGAARVAADASFAVLHGLYWLTVNLASRGPLLLAVDDLHWADAPSVRFLMFLARRLEALAVAVVAAARLEEPGVKDGPVGELLSQPGADILRPASLSSTSVGEIVAAGLGQAPDPAFASACHAATGGVPFLVRELVGVLAADGVVPTADAAESVAELGPRTVGRAALLRVARVSPGAVGLARSVAVLGANADLPRAARLAELEEPALLVALDALTELEILAPGRPLRFAHPILRAAIYDELGPGERSAAHARAADLLSGEGADLDAVAAHLLLTEPTGNGTPVERLRAAAGAALARGAPDSASAYLRRALEERVDQAQVVLELGSAERAARHPDAIEHLELALELAEERTVRCEIALELGSTLMYAGEPRRAYSLAERVLAEPGEVRRRAELRLRAFSIGLMTYDPELVVELDRRRPALLALAELGGQDARELLIQLAATALLRGEDPTHALGLLERALDEPEDVISALGDSGILSQVAAGFVLVDELGRAEAFCNARISDSLARGWALGYAAATGERGWTLARKGELEGAEADVRAALEHSQEQGMLSMVLAVVCWYGIEALAERPSLSDVATLVDELELPPELAETTTGAMILEVRGRLRLARGEFAGGIADLRSCGRTNLALRMHSPLFAAWRWPLATALATAEPDEARELATAELAAARRVNLPRAIGIAQRTLGIVEGGERGIALLRDAVATLADSPARLEHARALVELGAALRRAKHRSESRDPLRAGLDLARACGATRLSERARSELAATGAKPRRERITGRDALTPSEQRIAAIAATGLTNREIAQSLFITPKSVENHLGRIYQKLGIPGRGALAQALGREESDA